MVVNGVSRPGIDRVVPRRRSEESRSFGVSAERTAQAEATIATAGVAATSLLSLQECESGVEPDRDARQHGSAVMDELLELQRALLGEGGPNLDRLEQLVRRPTTARDPTLAGILRAIRMRAGIELARRGRAAMV